MKPDNLSIELLETFVAIVEADGNAGIAAERLGITQPSISKRITALRAQTSSDNNEPWLFLKGRRWRLTAQGMRVHNAVNDLVKRFQLLNQFVHNSRSTKPIISIACGEQASSGIIRAAITEYLKENDCQIRLSTPRGKARIEGVASGQYDFAIVTDSPGTIQLVAQREVYVQQLQMDRFVFAANPSKRASWYRTWHDLPETEPVAAAQVLELPFIVPEIDSSRRQQFEKWFYKATGQTVNITIEAGGWQTILQSAAAGLGVGFATSSAVAAYQQTHQTKLTTRQLLSKEFPADPVRLIARKSFGKNAPDLSPQALGLFDLIAQLAKPNQSI